MNKETREILSDGDTMSAIADAERDIEAGEVYLMGLTDSLEALRMSANSIRTDIQLAQFKRPLEDRWSDEERDIHFALGEIICTIHRALDDDDECGCHDRTA